MKTYASKTPASRLSSASVCPIVAPKNIAQRALIRRILDGPRIQTRLTVGAKDDAYEREAVRVADHVMHIPESRNAESAESRFPHSLTAPASHGNIRIAASSAPSLGKLPIRRAINCPACERKETRQPVDSEVDEILRAESNSNGVPEVTPAVEARINVLRTHAQPLPQSVRDHFEPRFGRSFKNVRIHTGTTANQVARILQARAFTLGNTIAFANGEFQPGTFEGQGLLAHELTHTVQQGGPSQDGPVRTASDQGETVIQRVTHGPSTPTNCHNWKIPLPPWTAGSLAHLQAAFFFATNPGAAGRVLPEVIMPRGTKIMMGVPSPPASTPPGFMDLIGVGPGQVQIGEIKSTASAALATPQATHYLTRHVEWLSRAPFTSGLDLAYSAVLGGAPTGSLMSGLASVTGSGRAIGPFIGDPLKTFWLEADASGAIVYWCTGIGSVNPAWALVFRAIYRAIMDAFWDAYRTIVEGLEAVGEWIWDHPVLATLILVALVIIGLILAVLGGLLEIPTLGGSTPLTAGGVVLAFSASVALLALFGVDTSEMERSGNDVLAFARSIGDGSSASGADYERDADLGNWNAATPEGQQARFQSGLNRLAASTSGLPRQLLGRSLDALNPLSNTEFPSMTAENRVQIGRAAEILTTNPDSRIAAIGQRVKVMAGRVTV